MKGHPSTGSGEPVCVVKVEPEGQGPCVFELSSWAHVCEELRMLIENGEDGDRIIVTQDSMFRADVDALPEHDGW